MTREHTTAAGASRTGESAWTVDGQFSQSTTTGSTSVRDLALGGALASVDATIPTSTGPDGETVYELPRRGTTTSAEIAEAAWAVVGDV